MAPTWIVVPNCAPSHASTWHNDVLTVAPCCAQLGEHIQADSKLNSRVLVAKVCLQQHHSH